MRLVAIGKQLELRLEDKATGQLFAKCPVEEYPGPALESVTDSSRYFVARLKDDGGRTAFIGLGFADRGDSFDLNVALQDHFKHIEKSAELAKKEAVEATQPKLDLGFKQGETIRIKFGNKTSAGSRPRPAPSSGAGCAVPLLPPPPGGSGPAGSPRVNRPAARGTNISPELAALGALGPPTTTTTSSATSAGSTSGDSGINSLMDF